MTVRLNGCPAKHLDDDDLSMWLRCYRWLNTWHLTPVTQGYMRVEDLDPRYYEAMELIDSLLQAEKEK